MKLNSFDSRLRKYSSILISAIICITLSIMQGSYANSLCKGHFVNPITDIDWNGLFPLTIGNADIASGDAPDTSNPSNPVCLCPMPIGYRIGLAIGYWEPFAMADITRKPYCLVNMGGIDLHIGKGGDLGGEQYHNEEGSGAFYWVHWYKYPLIYWLNIITSLACLEKTDFDIAYLTELDPTWNDDALALVLNPDAILFGNPVAQLSCAADAAKTAAGSSPINALFWCMGSQGSTYPLTGNVSMVTSRVQAATLLAERMDFKMHREALVWDSAGQNAPAVCRQYPTPIMPKNRYRYEMVNVETDADHVYPFGHTVIPWQEGKDQVGQGGNFGFLIWRKRNCCFL